MAHACARVLVDAISDDDTTRATRLAEEAGAALAYNHITSLLLNTCDDAAMPLDEPEAAEWRKRRGLTTLGDDCPMDAVIDRLRALMVAANPAPGPATPTSGLKPHV
ncbi:hypothetical protein V8C86DRAFT_2445558 [Haematococcus lacustris]